MVGRREYVRSTKTGVVHVLLDDDDRGYAVSACGKRLAEVEELSERHQAMAEAGVLPRLCPRCDEVER